MRLVMFAKNERVGIAASRDGHQFYGMFDHDKDYPGDLDDLIHRQTDLGAAASKLLEQGRQIGLDEVALLPPVRRPEKILCVGLNYADHTAESGYDKPDYPVMFARFTSSLIGHGAPIVRPRVSAMLDYEGEFVAVIGRGGRDIPKQKALDHVAGYALFNDASIRDVQLRTSQWTMGKNFDGTGAFGPYLVTADALPPGCKGLQLITRLNGQVMQSASTSDMIFDVATLIAILSQAVTLTPGDLIVTGTPAGVGGARKPPIYMKPGDICEVEIEGLGILRNGIADQPALLADQLALT